MYASSHGNEVRSVLVTATSVFLFGVSRVEGGAANYTATANSTVTGQPPAVPASSVAGFIVLLCVLVVAVCATVVTCCISGVWKALSRKNGTAHSHAQSQLESQNGGDLIPRPPSQLAVTSPAVTRPSVHNNVYTLQSLPRYQARQPHPNPQRNGHVRHYSLSNPNQIVLTPSMLSPLGARMYSFRDKSASSHSSDSALVQYSTQTSENGGVTSAAVLRGPTPSLATEGRRNSMDTAV